MRFKTLVVAVVLAGAAAGAARADEGVVAYVEGRAVQTAQLREAAVRFAQRLAGVPEVRRAGFIAGQLVDVAILSDAARLEGVSPPTVDADRDYGRDSQAAQAMLNKIVKESAPEESEVRSAYDAQVPGLEYRARHILVATEEQALAARGRIVAGERFEDVARSVSSDRSTVPAGGDLGWFLRDRMVPEFGTAVAALSPGALSEPVRSQFGWHLIRLDETRPQTIPPYENDAQRVRAQLFQKAVGRRLAAMRAAADVRWVMPKPAGW